MTPFSRKYPSVSGIFRGVVLSGLALLAMLGGITGTAVAGDLLRGGYTNSNSGSSQPGSFTPPSVVQARQNASDVLARTTQTINAVNAMQSAARKLASAAGNNNLGANPNNRTQTLPNVPNGLNMGGLVPDSGLLSSGVANQVTTWQNATTPTQSTTNGQTVVNVTQTGADAILNWNQFNIGKQTTLNINQSAGGASESTWIAFNIIHDPSAVPSQILGSIQAGGQVYVINQNGIIFGGASQINVHTLVASSLPINTFLISNGLLNNPDDQFLFSAVAQPAGTNGSPAFTPPASYLPSGADGDVIVQPGAQITAPANAASVGGRVALIGPNVDNEGTISTPDGQTILAAGLQVAFVAHPSDDPTLRGLDVYIGEISDPSYLSTATAGVATNGGLISAPSGDAYMAGATVDQLGVIASTTSVTLNGRVDLNASYDATSSGGVSDDSLPFLPQSAGAVLFGNNSVTEILPDYGSSSTVVDSGAFLNSVVQITGQTIHMAGDSTLLAPNATINANAGTWDYVVFPTGDSLPTIKDSFITSGGQIYLDSGAIIDAQGSWDVPASVTQNIISLQLLGPELADSPSQRDGVLADQTIYVDVRDTGIYNGMAWVGTPLVDDVSSFAALIDYTVGELTINGGTVNLTAGGSVVMQPGSQVNVSGGWIDYQGGIVSTSEVISGGHVYPISEAYPDMLYQGFNMGTFTVYHPTYGVSSTFTDPLLDLSHYENSYISGGNGGSVAITAPSVALDGQFFGSTVVGPRQTSVLSSPNSLVESSFPTPGAFSLIFEQEGDYPNFEYTSPTPPSVVFSQDTMPAPAPFAVNSDGVPNPVSAAEQNEVILSPNLFTTGGFGTLKLNNGDGNVTLPAGVSLNPGPDGSITVSAANMDVEGSVTAPGGNIAFTVYDFSPFGQTASLPAVDPTRGNFILGSNASLSAAGLIVDDREGAPDPDSLPLITNGGTISITSFSADLKTGSAIDVSGGVALTTSGEPAYGNGGAITIAAGQDPGILAIVGGKLVLGSELAGFSGAKGGSLSIGAPSIQVGGASAQPGTLLISPDFFDQDGFTSFTLSGFGGLNVEPDTRIDPVVTSIVAAAPVDSGNKIQMVQTVLPEGMRPPVSLALDAPGVNDPYNSQDPILILGDVVMGLGSVISTDPGASVTEKGNTVTVLGSIYAPGGSITIQGGINSTNYFPGGAAGVPTVEIGPQSVLSAAGATVLTPNALGYRTGSVLNGGTITITGNIVAEAGAVLNVSGASAILDITPAQANVNATPGGLSGAVQNGSLLGMLLVPAEVDSNGGSINLNGGQELFTDATLVGSAGGRSAVGGSLSVSAAGFILGQTPVDPTLIVTQGGRTIPASYDPTGRDAVGNVVLDANGNAIAPLGYFSVDTFNNGGFNSLTLAGSVQFNGPVSITVPGSLFIANGGVITADASVNLTATYVSLGLPFIPPTLPVNVTAPFTEDGGPTYFNPTYGTGTLTVNANLIDIGTLSLQNIGSANFIANNGDIRGDGTLDVAGSIFMKAGQVYVPTEVNFTIAAYDKNIDVASSTAGSAAVTLASAVLPPGFGVGSPLLGSTVQSIDGTTVTLASGASTTVSSPTDEDFAPNTGSVTFASSGTRQLPLSAGGVLDVYASTINQDGVLRAPMGTINLGWNGAGTAPVDPITDAPVAATQNLTLGAGSITSVSAVDPLTGVGEIIPYGTNPDGISWIDPSGLDITAGGVPQKSIAISAVNVNDEQGAVIDIRGGGDLMTAQFLPGIGGNNDILGSSSSFAILPNYQADYAPYDTDAGYNNSSLAVGDRIYLNASPGLGAGYYTLLPARYALLPGGILVTPQSDLPTGITVTLPDGGSLVSGYRFSPGDTAAPVNASFELDSGAVVARLADYTVYSGNTFLAQGATLDSQPIPRLPQDSGELSFQAVNSLGIAGTVESTPVGNGLGGLVDIASPENIVIAGPGVAQSGALVLSANELSSFGAASLLIGGLRQGGEGGETVQVETANITVDNSGDPLTGADIILACTDALTVDPDAEIEGIGSASGAEAITVSGNGALLRVSSDPTVTVTRTDVSTATQPELTIGAGAKITGGSVSVDSSSGTSLDPNAIIQAASVALDSGQITVELTNAGSVAPTTGLVLSGQALDTLFGSAQSLSLLSYSSIDFYGAGQLGGLDAGGQAALDNLALNAGEIRGFNSAGGQVKLAAQNILIENTADATGPGPVAASGGTLVLNGETVAFGANAQAIDQFTAVDMNGSAGIIAQAPSGSVTLAGALNLTAPMITGAAGAAETITAGGALAIAAPANPGPVTVEGGLGASLTFTGASVTDNSAISLPSGSLTLHATAGDLEIGNLAAATLDVSGVAKTFFTVTQYTNGGQINLIADKGNVFVAADTTLYVASQPGGGNAGTLTISAPNGSLALGGNLSAQGGVGGESGSFSLDAGALPTTGALDASLNAADFDQSRTIEVRTGDVLVDGLATAVNFNLSADAGSITVSGEIDGSGETGGAITLQAEGSVTLLSGAVLTVAAQNFDDAQRGGSVDLEAGSEVNGVASSTAYVNIEAGSTINLSVANPNPAQGDLTGTLLIRAPQTASNTDLQVDAINGTITGASSITVEGYEIYNTASDNGSIDDQEGNVYANGETFAGNTAAITSRLLAGNASLSSQVSDGATALVIEPGAEIINPTGDLTLASNWDLAPYRFGPDNVAGDLTLRAAGNLIFEYNFNESTGASLSDGFDVTQSPDGQLWDAPLLSTVGAPSWSYRLVAGADFSSANFAALTPLAALAAGSGSVLLGDGAPILSQSQVSTRSDVLPVYFETIRTGAGSIQIYAGRDVQLLDSLATIYSAGTQAPVLANFNLPSLDYRTGPLGEAQYPFYPAQYTEYGGSVTIVAQDDIAHYVTNGNGGLTADSSLELPDNWLYRQGAIDPTNGQMDVASTSWWIDFSNFVEGVGALGGGNVTLSAGNDITNVDAVIPTNARMPNGTPDAAALVQLGGGDLVVSAGNDISGGVYYVEQGTGVITAGGQIMTNSTRATLNETAVQYYASQGVQPDSSTWLPTTLFAGDASFDVEAGGNVLLGPVANPFLLPQGINNSYFNRSYFSTYAPGDYVDVESLSGNVTIRNDTAGGGEGSLQAFLAAVDSQVSDIESFAAVSEPWLKIAEAATADFNTAVAVMPGTLEATAFSGSINIEGTLLLSPAPQGTVELFAANSINALQINGFDNTTSDSEWATGVIDLSDADPASIPGIASPISGSQQPKPRIAVDPLAQFDMLFNETGSTAGAAGVIQTKEALHSPGLLHADDSTPAYLYAADGAISGLTLYSGKFTDVIAGQDITDASFYIQNVSAADISVISAGRDIIPYDPNSPLRIGAQSTGNELLNAYQVAGSFPASGDPDAGDLQINGPGTLVVLAGRDLTLGAGPTNSDGTADGITSIGNQRDPYLPSAGAELVVAAGLGGVAQGLFSSSLDISAFVSGILDGPDGAGYFTDLAATSPTLDVPDMDAFNLLSAQEQAVTALDLFYIVLRDAGRDHDLVGNAGYGNYAAGMAAIRALLPSFGSGGGAIDATSKEITTENGGDIDIIDPSGQITVGVNLAGAQPLQQGIFTEDGGNISIYSQGSVNLGTSRVFTLRGGNIIMWSATGDIDAGNSSKTVQSAPPTRVVVDPQSANVETDLAGLATGGGIGVLATVVGVPPGNVDLIAPTGTINAGNAGIQATGNVNLAAAHVLNAFNIQAAGSTTGTPTVTIAAPNLGALSAASSAAGAGSAAATQQVNNQSQQEASQPTGDSVISVNVIGYGGGDAGDDAGG